MGAVPGSGVWTEVVPGVLRTVGTPVDVNCVLVLGRDRALVIDTGSTAEEGTRLLADVLGLAGGRELVVVNTHAHYDHCFGNFAFQDRETWAAAGCVADLVATGEQQRRQAAWRWRSEVPAFAKALESTPIVPAGRQVEHPQSLELGGSVAELLVIGRGHTDHDLVVWLPALKTMIAGDLVEASGPPQLEDSFPLSWADRLDQLLALGAVVTVPGHGRPVGERFVRAQARSLRRLADWCVGEMSGGVTAATPPGWSAGSARIALRRARLEVQEPSSGSPSI